MIRVMWYFATGKFSHAADYGTAGEAFAACEEAGMDAHAFPLGTEKGLYNWQREREHTLSGFEERMALIGDPLKYEEWRSKLARLVARR